MELEEALKEMKIEIENFENDLKALEKTDIDAEYKIQIVNELIKYILVRQTILNHLTKQEKIIELMAEELEEWTEFLDEEGYYTCLLSMNKEEVKQYFEKKAEER